MRPRGTLHDQRRIVGQRPVTRCNPGIGLASFDHACRDHGPIFIAARLIESFDRRSTRWLGISDLIAEPEGPTLISGSYAAPSSRVAALHASLIDDDRMR